MRVATCSFRRFTPDMGVPVRLTYGGAPAGLPYTLRHNAGEVSPDLAMMGKPYEEYRALYRRKLEAFGFDALGRLLRGILTTERAGDDTPVVLLSDTDLTRPGAWCHRTILAEWITENGGGLVAELAPGVGVEGGAIDEYGTPTMF